MRFRDSAALPRQPDLDVVGLLRGKAHVAGAQGHHAVVQAEPAQHFLGAGQHALVLVFGLLRRGDRDQFHLGELMLADHAAGVLAGGARFGAEARRQRGQPHRQRVFVEDGLAHEIGQRDFGGGDEPELVLWNSIGFAIIACASFASCQSASGFVNLLQ